MGAFCWVFVSWEALGDLQALVGRLLPGGCSGSEITMLT